MMMTNHLGVLHRHHRRHRRRRRPHHLGHRSGTDHPCCVEAQVAAYPRFESGDSRHNHPPEAEALVEDPEDPDPCYGL